MDAEEKQPRLYTIGFTKKTAETFFNLLRTNGIKKVIDVRLENTAQLAGFSKKDDLRFFLKEICQCGYEHRPNWAPTKKLLDGYKHNEIPWDEYVVQFSRIIQDRGLMENLELASLEDCCLLCSEPTPEHCHRRLLAERIKMKFPNIRIIHLK